MTDPIEQLKLAAASASGFNSVLEQMMETYHRYSAIADISIQETLNEIQSIHMSLLMTAIETYDLNEADRIEMMGRLFSSTIGLYGMVVNDYETLRNQAYVKRYPTDEA